MNVTNITELRTQLTEARIRLRSTRDLYDLAKVTAEAKAIETAGGAKNLGANEDERRRALCLALAESDSYSKWLSDVRLQEAALDRIEAALSNELDVRRAREWAVRERLADALMDYRDRPAAARGENPDDHPEAIDNHATDLAIAATAALPPHPQWVGPEPWDPDYVASATPLPGSPTRPQLPDGMPF